MIAELTGICQRRRIGQVIISVNGIGFSVNVPEKLADSLEVGQQCTLHTKLLVRDNDMSLVGFATASERDLFSTLVNVSGIGSKLALSILSKLTPSEFVTAVLGNDEKTLVSVQGLGSRSAKKLLLEMETKISKLAKELPQLTPKNNQKVSTVNPEAKAALISFGCSEEEAERALESIAGTVPADAEVSDLVMAAMRALD